MWPQFHALTSTPADLALVHLARVSDKLGDEVSHILVMWEDQPHLLKVGNHFGLGPVVDDLMRHTWTNTKTDVSIQQRRAQGENPRSAHRTCPSRMSIMSSNSSNTSGLGCSSAIRAVLLMALMKVEMMRVMSRVAAASRPVL